MKKNRITKNKSNALKIMNMKKKILRRSGQLSFRINFTALLTTLCSLLPLQFSFAQSYTYETESFEDAVWSNAASSSNPTASTTGMWTVAKKNIQSNAIPAYEGSYSLILATKSNALITPTLDKGAGILTYYINRTGGGRTIMVHTSADMVTWNSPAADSVSVPSEWTLRRIEINDPAVRYIRFSTNSNGGVYIDNVRITPAGDANIAVTTQQPWNITQTSAQTGGLIVSESITEITERGICYNTTGFPDISSDKAEAGNGTGEFTVQLNNLVPGTTYYMRSYAITEMGVNYGEISTFTTRSGDAPVTYWMQPFDDLSQIPGSNPTDPLEITVPGQGTWIYKGAYKDTNPLYIQDGSACCIRLLKNSSYIITPLLEDGVSELSFFEARGKRELTIYISYNEGSQWELLQKMSTVKGEVNTVSINSASANRIKIANESGGDANIDNLSVTVFPSGTSPSVTTTPVSNIGKNTATSGGEITETGSRPVIERGICWSTTSTPLIADHRTMDGEGAGAFISELTGLPAGKLIYIRAYARSRAGTGYGSTVTFTTDPATLPVVTTTTASNVTGETAISGGTVIDNGGAPITEQGVCWNTTGNPSIQDNKTSDETTSGTFQSRIKYLNPNTSYYYRAYAVNEAGIAYGTTESFTTGSISLPAVTTSEISSALSYKITGGGIITDNGNAPVTYGLCWNETGNPSIQDSKTISENDESAFVSEIGNLKSATRYFIRAYVTNSAGTSYGEIIQVTTAVSTVLYVSPNGNDLTADGSKEKPFFSVQKAIDLVSAGDTIYMESGVYRYSQRINIGNIGEPNGGTICLFAVKGKRALLDFSDMPFDSNNQGIRLTGSYWHFYGLDIKGAGDNGMLIERNKPIGGTFEDIAGNTEQAHHNTVEFCSFFENKDTGLQLKNLAEYNRIINCDSYYNRDPDDGDADGFAPKLTVGTGNYFYGCRAWNNSDDGWDGLLTATENGFKDDMTTVIENCWAFNNGFLKDGTPGKGNGNGFKLGGSGNYDQRHNMILKRCLAFDNLMKGFDQNHNVGNMTLINCTGFSNKYLANKNHYTYKIDGTILAPDKELTLINCVAVCDGLEADKSAYAPCNLNGGTRTTCDFMTSASDYVTTDTTGVRGARKADGSLPDIDFMQIKPGNSKLIDTGTIVESISFSGSKPDLGCFETGIYSGIEEVIAETPDDTQNILVYPQPATDRFTVRLDGKYEKNLYKMRIFNLNGKEVFGKVFDTDLIVVERGNMDSGIYIIQIFNEASGKIFNTKLIIK